jgi:Carboxypeptidase regulatory-like domain
MATYRSLMIVRTAALVLACAPAAYAQQTTGNIAGRIVDQQNAGVPGATVTASNTQTGFVRSAVSDSEGLYRLSALPVGTYDVKVELTGFSTLDRKGIIVNVGQTLDVGFALQVAQLAESVNVTGASPLVEVSSSSVGASSTSRTSRVSRSTAGSSRISR